jgi:hypothetical protein
MVEQKERKMVNKVKLKGLQFWSISLSFCLR